MREEISCMRIFAKSKKPTFSTIVEKESERKKRELKFEWSGILRWEKFWCRTKSRGTVFLASQLGCQDHDLRVERSPFHNRIVLGWWWWWSFS